MSCGCGHSWSTSCYFKSTETQDDHGHSARSATGMSRWRLIDAFFTPFPRRRGCLLWPGASLRQDVPLFSADGSMFYTILPAKQGARGEFHHIAGLSAQVAQHIFHHNLQGKQETVCLHSTAACLQCSPPLVTLKSFVSNGFSTLLMKCHFFLMNHLTH